MAHTLDSDVVWGTISTHGQQQVFCISCDLGTLLGDILNSYLWKTKHTNKQTKTVSCWTPDSWMEFNNLSHLEPMVTVPKTAPLSRHHYRPQKLSSYLLKYFLSISDSWKFPFLLSNQIICFKYMCLYSYFFGFIYFHKTALCMCLEQRERGLQVRDLSLCLRTGDITF